jgi:hypothetical protein
MKQTTAGNRKGSALLPEPVFGLAKAGTDPRIEFVAGLITFLTMVCRQSLRKSAKPARRCRAIRKSSAGPASDIDRDWQVLGTRMIKSLRNCPR